MAESNGTRGWIINALFTLALFLLGYVINDLRGGIGDLKTSVNTLSGKLDENNDEIVRTRIQAAELQTRLDYIEAVAKARSPIFLVKKK